MDEYRQKAIAVSAFIFLGLLYLNILSYSVYKLPVGMVDVDHYLYYLGDKDPRVEDDINFKPFDDWRYTLFYNLIYNLGPPRITLLWFPPLLLGGITYLIYCLYSKTDTPHIAFFKMMAYTFLTYNIWFLYASSLYRQTLAIFLLLLGYELYHWRKHAGILCYLLAVLTHMHITPIFLIYWLADAYIKKNKKHIALILIVGLFGIFTLKGYQGISILTGAPQPTFYIIYFIAINPLLWHYALRNLKHNTKDILYILLLLTMPFSDQSRGLIFLHILLIDKAADNYLQYKENRIYRIILLLLSYFWFQNMIKFLTISILVDATNRGLDIKPILSALNIKEILFRLWFGLPS